MTDNEIIKALECCLPQNGKRNCDDCPYAECEKGCADKMIKDSLDLINRQKAEIEMLKKQIVLEVDRAYDRGRNVAKMEYTLPFKTSFDFAKKVKTEAIREFGKFLIDKSRHGMILTADIPDYVKEMTEGDNG